MARPKGRNGVTTMTRFTEMISLLRERSYKILPPRTTSHSTLLNFEKNRSKIDVGFNPQLKPII